MDYKQVFINNIFSDLIQNNPFVKHLYLNNDESVLIDYVYNIYIFYNYDINKLYEYFNNITYHTPQLLFLF